MYMYLGSVADCQLQHRSGKANNKLWVCILPNNHSVVDHLSHSIPSRFYIPLYGFIGALSEFVGMRAPGQVTFKYLAHMTVSRILPQWLRVALTDFLVPVICTTWHFDRLNFISSQTPKTLKGESQSSMIYEETHVVCNLVRQTMI